MTTQEIGTLAVVLGLVAVGLITFIVGVLRSPKERGDLDPRAHWLDDFVKRRDAGGSDDVVVRIAE